MCHILTVGHLPVRVGEILLLLLRILLLRVLLFRMILVFQILSLDILVWVDEHHVQLFQVDFLDLRPILLYILLRVRLLVLLIL